MNRPIARVAPGGAIKSEEIAQSFREKWFPRGRKPAFARRRNYGVSTSPTNTHHIPRHFYRHASFAARNTDRETWNAHES